MGFDSRAVMVDTTKERVHNDIGQRYLAGTLNVNDRVLVAAPAMQVSGHVDMTALQSKLKHCILEGPDEICMGPMFPEQLDQMPFVAGTGAVASMFADLENLYPEICAQAHSTWKARPISTTIPPPPPPPHTRLEGAGQFGPNNPCPFKESMAAAAGWSITHTCSMVNGEADYQLFVFGASSSRTGFLGVHPQ